jgi:hypothetical protein
MSDRSEEHDSNEEIDPEEEIQSIREQEEFAANTKALRKSFKMETPPHLLCSNCGFDIDAWKFWETVILEQIEFQKARGSAHLLDQIEKTHEIFLAECPECGEVADFRGDSK